MPEVTFIPTAGDSAVTGAAAFLAALAFPHSTPDRDRFLAALSSSISRGSKSLLRDDGRRINKALQRIYTRRVPAGNAALNLCLRGGLRFGRLVLKNKYHGITEFAFDKSREFVRHSDPSNFIPQVWKDSFPVLHMAMAFNLKAAKHVNAHPSRGVLPALLLDTSWLLPAMRVAAFHLLQLPGWLQNFDMDTAVLLLPKEPDPTLDLYKGWVRGEVVFEPISNVT